jgi:hypothetical protein
MSSKGLAETNTYIQNVNNVHFLVHCSRDVAYTTKITSLYGVLDKNQNHPTWRMVDGEWKSFKYAEPFL